MREYEHGVDQLDPDERDDESAKAVHDLFTQTPLDAWEPIQAGSFLEARFILQHTACEVALVHEDLVQREGGQSLAPHLLSVSFKVSIPAGHYPCFAPRLPLDYRNTAESIDSSDVEADNGN